METTLDLIVRSVTKAARRIKLIELQRQDEGALPHFTAGAHIDLHLSNGLSRSYSLCHPASERNRYVVAVSRDEHSRGGSILIHDALREGDRIKVSEPRNHFPLAQSPELAVFIAGGIGITPIWSMVQQRNADGLPWALFYSCRTQDDCAFRREIEQLASGRQGSVHFAFDQEAGGKSFDLREIVATLSPRSHVYCCGPNAMLEAFQLAASAAAFPPSRIHVEYFKPAELPALTGGYTVILQRTGASYEVQAGESILDILLDNDVEVPFNCMEGTCRSCETAVLQGVPDHRDSVLTPDEKASNKKIMICCSGSKSKELVLDL